MSVTLNARSVNCASPEDGDGQSAGGGAYTIGTTAAQRNRKLPYAIRQSARYRSALCLDSHDPSTSDPDPDEPGATISNLGAAVQFTPPYVSRTGAGSI